MAETGPIQITLDEEALRAQVRRVLDEELGVVADRLLSAAFTLAPERMMRRDDAIEEAGYQRAQRDQAEQREQEADQ